MTATSRGGGGEGGGGGGGSSGDTDPTSPAKPRSTATEDRAAAIAMQMDDFNDEILGGGDGGLDEEDGEDPVVREVPVYLSGHLAQELHVIQYPNRPFYRPYDVPAAARLKPHNKLLELEYALPRDSEHLDEEAPQHLRLDRIKVQSSYLDPMTTYAIGALRDGALHLTPLAGIFQMRASCEHVDAAPVGGALGVEEHLMDLGLGGMVGADFVVDDSEAEGAVGGAAGAHGGPKMAVPPPPTATAGGGGGAPPVKLQHIEYKKRESEKAAAARRTSYAFKKQQEESEPWTELRVHPFKSEESQRDYARMFCRETERPIRFKGGHGVYADMYRAEKAKASSQDRGDDLSRMIMVDHHHHQQHSAALLRDEELLAVDDKANVLVNLADAATVPSPSSASSAATGGKNVSSSSSSSSLSAPIMSIQHLRGAEQIAVIMERAHVVSLEQVLELNGGHTHYHLHAPSSSPYVQTLEHLKKHAVLVRGNWVRKSSLYGFPPRLVQARDALLLLLERHGGVNRLLFCKATNITDEESQHLLRPIAALDKETRMWVGACPDDTAFLGHFPEVVAQQQKLWRDREKELQGILSALESDAEHTYPGPVVVAGGGAVNGHLMEVTEASGGGGGGESRPKSKKKR